MRRAIIAVVATVAGLIALLGYKSSSGTTGSSHPVVVPPQATTTTTTTTAGPTGTTTTTTAGTTPTTTGPAETGHFTGNDTPYTFGDIQLEVTLSDGKLSSISVVRDSAADPRSQAINSQALPILTREALAAQGVRIDVVSGATFTSNAFARALQSALGRAGR
jgi:uncharacterized protein with FMN-binding domain